MELIYPDDQPLEQLIKLLHDLPSIEVLARNLGAQLGVNSPADYHSCVIIDSKDVTLGIRREVNEIAAEFAMIEQQIADEKAAGELVDSGCDYTDDYSAQWRDAVTGWMQ